MKQSLLALLACGVAAMSCKGSRVPSEPIDGLRGGGPQGAAVNDGAPSVVATIPADLSVGVPVTSGFIVVFSTPMNPTSMTSHSLTLSNVSGTVRWNGGFSATFTPAVALAGC